MDSIVSLSPKNPEVSKNQQPSKKRKVVEKTVVKVKIGTNVGKLPKNEFPPSDSWSWRKYGQKPIKGSPYPRGYYRCSTSKGCSAKKQVERCKSDDSLLIITYTSSHNHPDPNHDLDHDHVPPLSSAKQDQPITITDKVDHDNNDDQKLDDDLINNNISNNFHYIAYDESPLRYGLELEHLIATTNYSTTTCTTSINSTKLEKNTCDQLDTKIGLVLEKLEPPLIISGQTCNLSSSSPSDQENNDFFDELEELPLYSNFTGFMSTITHLSDEIRNNNIPIVPS